MTISDVIANSVTKEDHTQAAIEGGVLMMPLWFPQRERTDIPPYHSFARDLVLSSAPRYESLWGGAVTKAATKVAARDWSITDSDDSTRKTSHAQNLLLNMGGEAAYVRSITRHIHDYLNCNNGAPIEIVRASSAKGSRIIGLMPLDSLRCERTGDSATPFLYHNISGKVHELKDWQVLDFVDSPSSRVDMRGVGLCAADRCWSKIRLLAAIELYAYEKVTGDRVQSLYIVSGPSPEFIKQSLDIHKSTQKAKGMMHYRGAAIATTINPNATVNLVEIPFASLPDGFDPEQERTEGRLVYAHNIGLNLDDLQPRPAGLNSGFAAEVARESSEGLGLAAWFKQAAHNFSHRVLPASTTFAWSSNDLTDKQKQADIDAKHIDAAVKMVTPASETAPALLTKDQGLNYLVDKEVLDRDYFPQDVTPDNTVHDTEKPEIGNSDAINPAREQPSQVNQ